MSLKILWVDRRYHGKQTYSQQIEGAMRGENELQRRHEKLIERYQRKESDSKFVLRQITKIKS